MMRRLGIFAAAFAVAAAGFILLGNAAAALITAAVTGALAGVFLLLRCSSGARRAMTGNGCP